MPERVLLTPAFVDSIEPPEAGERWISDLKVRGFGLRVWRGTEGSLGISYAIRAKGSDGKFVRKTGPSWRFAHLWYQENRIWRRLNGEIEKPTYGELLPYAREWAIEQILTLRGLPTLADAEAAQEEFRAYKRQQISQLNLEELVKLELKNMKNKGNDQTYIDRSLKLFYKHFPISIRSEQINSINIDQIELCLNSTEITESNFNVLRPLIGRAFNLAQSYGRLGTIQQWEIAKILRPRGGLNSYRKKEKWADNEIENLINQIKNLDVSWQSRISICLFLELSRIPLSQLLSARWNQVYFITPTKESRSHASYVNIRWTDGWLGFEPINMKAGAWLEKALAYKSASQSNESYIFPSPRKETNSHIQSVNMTWSKALKLRGMPYTSLVKFRKELHRNNHPSPYYDIVNARVWRPPLTTLSKYRIGTQL